MSGCENWGQVRTEIVEVPVRQFVELDEALVDHVEPAPLPAPACKDGGRDVSCVAQLIDWIEDEWCPAVRAHNCDKALIRCTQPVQGKQPDPASLMRCITKAGAKECSASCYQEK
jgi:hypothetical protein